MPVRIVTDSTCDLPPEVLSEHKITVVPLFINFGSESFRDGVDLSSDDLYTRLPSAHPPPTTSAPGTAAFTEIYRRLIAEGASAILSIHVGDELSNVANVARLAAAEVAGAPIRVLDAGQISLGIGYLAVRGARLAASGAELDEIEASVQALAGRTYTFAAIDTLEYLRRSGRINLVMFGVGTLLQVKPILKMHSGEVTTERARTSKGAIDRLLDLALRLHPLESIALVHANAPDRLDLLRRQVEARLADVPIQMVGEVGPIIGTHVGPGAVGVVCIEAPSHRSQRS
jgi:DegV family protein with EDD domain